MTGYSGPDAPRKICLVCGRVLDYHERTGTYEHTIATIQDDMGGVEDHPVIDVFPRDAPEQVRGLCDFCYAEAPTWIVPARSFELPKIPNAGSTGDWAACVHCAPLVAKDRWNEVFRRSKAGYEARNGAMIPPVETALKAMHRKLRKNITGAPYEGQPTE
jgi:hypothetical protein